MLINDPEIIKESQVKEDEKKGIVEILVHDVQSLKTVAGRLNVIGFDHCVSVTGIDFKGKIAVIWHLSSYGKNELRGKVIQLRIDMELNTQIDSKTPKNFRAPVVSVPSLVDIWESALFHEREAHEMFGIDFQGHPDLRHILLSDDFYGKWPMRKDFTFNKSDIKIE